MKKGLIICSLLVAIIISVAAVQPNKYFKNLQVLPKNISNDSLDMYMEMFCDGLNVGCDYCHIKISEDNWDMASDDKEEKEVTRHMMRMMFDMNKTYFSFEDKAGNKPLVVTCITCHKGEAHIEQWERKKH